MISWTCVLNVEHYNYLISDSCLANNSFYGYTLFLKRDVDSTIYGCPILSFKLIGESVHYFALYRTICLDNTMVSSAFMLAIYTIECLEYET